jgi:hypothetical protein
MKNKNAVMSNKKSGNENKKAVLLRASEKHRFFVSDLGLND